MTVCAVSSTFLAFDESPGRGSYYGKIVPFLPLPLPRLSVFVSLTQKDSMARPSPIHPTRTWT